MASPATPPRIGAARKTPINRPRRPQRLVELRLRLADAENRALSDTEYGRLLRATVLAHAYGSISPAALAMRTGATLEDATATLDRLAAGGALPAEQTGRAS